MNDEFKGAVMEKTKFKFKSDASRNKVKETGRRTNEGRRERMSEAAAYLEERSKESPDGVCVVCGDFMDKSLDEHHPYIKAKNPICKVSICGSCHRIFDKGGGLDELKERKARYWIYNMGLRERKPNEIVATKSTP